MGSKLNPRQEARFKRKKRIRTKIYGSPERPRLSVFRSSKHIYAQVIDDLNGVTLVAGSTLHPEIREQEKVKGKMEDAKRVARGMTICTVTELPIMGLTVILINAP